MGNLSEHFNKEQFACICGECQREFKISLTLVGILEDVWTKFNLPLTIKKAYICEAAHEKETAIKKNYYSLGKAVRFSVPKDKLITVFRYLETFPEITGLGINIEDSFIHIDLREKEHNKWIYNRSEEIELTAANRGRYELGDNVERQSIPEPATLELNI